MKSWSLAGPGRKAAGQMLRMEQMIVVKDTDHDQKDQYLRLRMGAARDGWANSMFMCAGCLSGGPGAMARFSATRKPSGA